MVKSGEKWGKKQWGKVGKLEKSEKVDKSVGKSGEKLVGKSGEKKVGKSGSEKWEKMEKSG